MGRSTVRPGQKPVRWCGGAECAARVDAGHSCRPAVRDLQLCSACRDALTAGLRRMPRLYEECGQLLDGGRAPGSIRERTSGGAVTGIPLNTAAVEVRASITGALGAWTGLVAEARRTPPPPRTVTHLSAFLIRHVDWLAAHPASGDASAEIAALLRTGQRVLRPAERRVRVGNCPEPGCGGALTALLRADSSAESARVSCNVNAAHSWSGRDWVRLSRRVRERGSAASGAMWLTATDITRLWAVPSGSVYRLASTHAWRRRREGRRVYYHVADVQQALEARHAPAP